MRRSISFFGGESRLIEEQRRRKEKKTVMLLVWVVIVFILAWLPLNSLSVLLDLNLYKTIFRYFENVECLWSTDIRNTGTWYRTDIFICFPILLCIKNKLDNVCMCVSSAAYPDGDDTLFRAWFCLCHITSLLSALANPILYGYFNEVCVNLKDSGMLQRLDFKGFRREFCQLINKRCCRISKQEISQESRNIHECLTLGNVRNAEILWYVFNKNYFVIFVCMSYV